MNIYLDNAATTAPRPEVIDTVNHTLTGCYGNPSSMHLPGRQAAARLEEARGHVAAAMGVNTDNIYFTSGGTESCNLAILGAAHALRHHKSKHIITSQTEHDAVKMPVKKLENEGWDVTYLMPERNGQISLAAFCGALHDDTLLVSIMLVNNETGAVNPIGGFTEEIKRRKLKTIMHTDAVQGFCKIPFTVTGRTPGADMISVSGHKLHGIKGVGALYAGSKIKLSPMILGGGQEGGLRSGTQATPAITGFGMAAQLGIQELAESYEIVRDLREHAINLLREQIPGVVIIGDVDSPNSQSPYILSISLPGFKSEVLMTYLDSEGIYVSKGAACKKGMRSPVLEAMKLPDNVIDGALRISFSRYNTKEEIEYFAGKLKTAKQTLIH